MKKYTLTENLPEPVSASKSIEKRFFFMDGDSICWRLDAHIDYMLSNNILEMDVWLAQPVINAPYFFCKQFEEVGDKGNCGKQCIGYKPKNGRSGVCRHYGCTYEQTDRKFTIKILDANANS
jgi:hypothetical protein